MKVKLTRHINDAKSFLSENLNIISFKISSHSRLSSKCIIIFILELLHNVVMVSHSGHTGGDEEAAQGRDGVRGLGPVDGLRDQAHDHLCGPGDHCQALAPIPWPNPKPVQPSSEPKLVPRGLGLTLNSQGLTLSTPGLVIIIIIII